MELRRNLFIATGTVLATAAISVPATAQTYPDRPVRILVPTAPGGAVDTMVRALAKELNTRLGQALVIENKPGANTIITAEACAKAANDGYTLCVLPNTTLTLNPSLYSKLPYDAAKSFTPIANLAVGQQVLVVRPSVPVKSVRELVDYSVAHPDELNYASSGIGSNVHVTLATLWKNLGASITHVPFKAASEAPLAFARGDIQVMYLIIGNPGVMDSINSGDSRPLLISGETRHPRLPDVPTFSESGLKGQDAPTWFGLFAPANTPKAIVDKLHTDVWASLGNPEFVNKVLTPIGFQTSASTPEEFKRFVDEQRAQGARMIEISGVRLDSQK